MAEALNKAEIERQFLASYRSWCKIMKKVKQDLDKEELTEEEIQLNIEDLNQSLNEFREVSLVTESILDEEDKITQHETFKSYEKETFELLNLLKVFRNKSKAPAEEEKPTCTNKKIDMAEVSSTSSRLSSASKRAERAAKVARLKTELSFVEAEAKAQAALNQLKIARELAATQAEINELDLQYNDMPVPTQPPDLPDCSEDMLHNYLDGQVTSLNPDAESYQPLQVQLPPITENLSAQKQSQEDSMLKLANILTEKCLKESLPTPEPSVFKGDSLIYPIWKKNFETFIENRTTDPANRLFYLTRYTSGESHEAIKSFSSLNTEEAFQRAKEILESRYGSPFMVANAYRRKIKDWAKILPDDGPGLRKFSDFLQSCLTAMHTVKYLAPLNDPEENQKMLKKLPSGLVNRWSRLADTRLQGTGDYPNFKDFCKFIETEARISCNPITSPNAIKENERFKNTKPTSHDNRYKAKTFQTGVKEESYNSEKCFKCKKPHSLNDCPEFLKLSPIDRFYYCQEESICRGCMEWGHIKKDCTKKKVCKTCKKFHPTSLHKDNYIPPKSNYTNYKKTEEPKHLEKSEAKSMMTFSANTSSACTNKIMRSPSHTHSQIVPVKVDHEQDADHNEIVVCVIDDQSDTCFVDEQLKKDLHLEGPDVSLELSTMHGTQTIFSQKITGLEVAGLFENVTIKVPVAYTRPFIPANESQIPRKETALKYNHLNQIANCLLPENVKIRVGMLIGINCIKAVKPVEVIPGEDDEPYGLKTALGWGIVGMVESSYSNEENEDIENMHNVCITSTSNKFCHFAFRTKVKEVVTVKQMNNLFDMDFQEDTQDKYISHEDTKFMDIMAKGIHQLENGQFEMPLPFRNPEMVLPNNKPAVLKRLNGLKKKLMKVDKYKEDYFKFMDSITQNGYSEIVTDEELKLEDGKIWYLPHFGTYHPRKPDKLRIVFDASISYNGSCLNNTLLQGPDLTNNLLGVLCRFRQERVAFICDIESMFFRFKVNREDRNFLRFFWWKKDNDLTKEPSTYRMTVHLFGATSSPGCANFGLKSTAELTQNQYGKKAADFIKKDFYVNDGLKSVATIEEAKDLIDKTVKMCKSGGLKLHKFLSNKKEALEDLPVSARAKNIDVDIDDSQIDRALGVQWCIQNDSFQFRINLQDRPLTRRGILSTVSSVFDPLGLVSPCILIGKQILKELCKEQIGWDDEIPNDIRAKWTKWRSELIQLSDLKIQRSFCPDDFGTVKSVQIHHFSDGSLSGYGQCSYVKLQNENGRTHCTLALAKSRVSPSKTVTVPRIELAAAVVSVKVAAMLRRELTLKFQAN